MKFLPFPSVIVRKTKSRKVKVQSYVGYKANKTGRPTHSRTPAGLLPRGVGGIRGCRGPTNGLGADGTPGVSRVQPADAASGSCPGHLHVTRQRGPDEMKTREAALAVPLVWVERSEPHGGRGAAVRAAGPRQCREETVDTGTPRAPSHGRAQDAGLTGKC